jgi:hypothetical protein
MKNTPRKFIFVSGSSRSGTTMLSEVLRRHSEIYAHNEMHYFGDVFPLPGDVQHLKDIDDAKLVEMGAWFFAREVNGIWRAEPTAADRARAGEIVNALPAGQRNGYALYAALAGAVADAGGSRHFCDHTPRNIFYADQILQAMPEAHFIHMIRDPRAVLASQKSRWKRRWLDQVKIPLQEVLRNWVSFHPYISTRLWKQAANHALSLQQHPRMFILKYEDLVSEPERVVGKLAAFLGVDFENEMLNVPVAGSSHETSRYEEKRITPEMVGRWRKTLKPYEALTCERLSQKEMAHFGYAFSTVDPPSIVGKLADLRLLITYPLHLFGALVVSPRRAFVQLVALLRTRSTINSVD